MSSSSLRTPTPAAQHPTDATRFTCVLHTRIHGHAAAIHEKSGVSCTWWPPGQSIQRAHRACVMTYKRRPAEEATPPVAAAMDVDSSPPPPAVSDLSLSSPSGALPSRSEPTTPPMSTRPQKRPRKTPARFVEEEDALPQHLTDTSPPAAAPSYTARSMSSLAEAKLVFTEQGFCTMRGFPGVDELHRLMQAHVMQVGKVATPAAASSTDVELISGRTTQAALHAHAAYQQHVAAHTDQLCRRVFEHLEVSHTGLHFVDPKLLSSSVGQGDQALHWDNYMGLDVSEDRLTVLFHLSAGPGMRTTLLPSFPVQRHFPRTRPDEAVGFGTPSQRFNQRGKQRMRESFPLLSKRHFHSEPAQLLDITVCRQSVIHAGSLHRPVKVDGRLINADDYRCVLFLMSSRDARSHGQDVYQRYVWQYIGDALGTTSDEYLRSVARAHADGFAPLERFVIEKQWRATVQLLDKAGHLATMYPAGAPAWHGIPSSSPSAASPGPSLAPAAATRARFLLDGILVHQQQMAS